MASPAQILRSILIDLGLVQFPGGNQPAGIAGAIQPYHALAETGYIPQPGLNTNLSPCYCASLPVDPDRVVQCVDSAGLAGGREMHGGRRHAMPGIRLIIRDVDYQAAFDLSNLIAVALDQNINITTTTLPDDGTTHYVQAVTRTTPVSYIGEEQANRQRYLFSINARMTFTDQEPNPA